MSRHDLDMQHGPVLPALVRFALPLALSGLLQCFLGTIGLVVIGRFGSPLALAAIGSVQTLANLFPALLVSLSVGSTVVAALHIGAGRTERVEAVTHASMALAAVGGGAAALLLALLLRPILRAMGTPEDVMPLAVRYMRIFLFAVPFSSIYNFGAALLRARGDTKRPLWFLSASGIVGTAVGAALVIRFGLDVAGAALAVVVSMVLASTAVLVCLVREPPPFRLRLRDVRFERQALAAVLRIGVPTAGQALVFNLSNLVMQGGINSLGPAAMAGGAASLNLEGFVWLALVGFSQAGMTFSSNCLGGGRILRIRRIVLESCGAAAASGLALGALFVAFGRPLLGCYTSDPAAVDAGMLRLGIVCGTYGFCGLMESLSCCVRGLGHSRFPAVVTALGVCGIRIGWVHGPFRLPALHTMRGLYFAYPLSWIATGAVLLVAWHVFYARLRR